MAKKATEKVEEKNVDVLFDEIFAEENEFEPEVKVSRKSKHVNEDLLAKFKDMFEKKVGKNAAFKMKTGTILKAFELETTKEKVNEETGEKETVEIERLPTYVINDLKEHDFDVEKIKANPGYEIVLIDMEEMEEVEPEEEIDIDTPEGYKKAVEMGIISEDSEEEASVEM